MIVDDHEVVRDGLCTLMKQSFLIDHCFFAKDSREALEFVNKSICMFDLILLDLSMPKGLDGMETLIQFKKITSETKVVIFSMFDEISYQSKAFKNGASGYLVKNLKSEELINSLDQIIAGKKVFDQLILKKDYEAEEDSSWDLPVSKREREVFILTVMGYKQKDIADHLNITVKTVENHRQHISDKLGTKKRHEWVEIAKKYNLFDVY